MPLIAHNDHPSFKRLKDEGQEVLSLDRAHRQDIRELHVGLLNMMPDAALEATDRQFMRLIGNCNRIAQIHVHHFSVDCGSRGPAARAHIERHYRTFDEVRRSGLDALIITGANPAREVLEDEPFWEPLVEVMEWSKRHVCSVVCSCLATHAYMQHFHGIRRKPCRPNKRWGIYEHHRDRIRHPLLIDLNTRFDAPHSHVYEITREGFEEAGLRVLSASPKAGVHLAVSAEGLRFVFFQGHPEYDLISLSKEYKREVGRFFTGAREDWPSPPENYFPPRALRILEDYREKMQRAKSEGGIPPEFPEKEIEPLLDNTWADTGKAMFNNWLGLVYQLTGRDRHQPFMDEVDPSDPLGLLAAKREEKSPR
ncbi:homoserine O-succinyltransferase MetA [Thioalkalivibrio sp. HK1]|uniref:homoserine O-succinyltransferase MetA n=1 Tax=Thioalkalivibrio sp. HK1 TaxID=1469245 RepID=UPI000472A921|nr:homoserine O-succinyltransferase [Thioalkalivibrio sp. HK1]